MKTLRRRFFIFYSIWPFISGPAFSNEPNSSLEQYEELPQSELDQMIGCNSQDYDYYYRLHSGADISTVFSNITQTLLNSFSSGSGDDHENTESLYYYPLNPPDIEARILFSITRTTAALSDES